MAGTRQEALLRQRRQHRLFGLLGFIAAVVTPVALFGGVVETLAVQPRLELQYIAGWTPWILLGCGLLFLVPVTWSAGLDPESRFFPRARNAYAGWGVSLYIMGFLLAWQVAEIQNAASG